MTRNVFRRHLQCLKEKDSSKLYRITGRYFVIGVIVDKNGYIVKTAPLGKWSLGKHSSYVFRYWRNCGHKIERIE